MSYRINEGTTGHPSMHDIIVYTYSYIGAPLQLWWAIRYKLGATVYMESP